jgi:hypothetical protein
MEICVEWHHLEIIMPVRQRFGSTPASGPALRWFLASGVLEQRDLGHEVDVSVLGGGQGVSGRLTANA